MEKTIIGDQYWKFPESIRFEEISNYIISFEDEKLHGELTFDLSQTQNIHSSFIGFLIHAKHSMNRDGGTLNLILSFTAERLLVMLNIMEFFMPDAVTMIAKKTA